MVMEYRIKNNIYTITNCTLTDIDDDYKLIYNDVNDCAEDSYKAAMKRSIKNGIAYRVVDKDGKLGFLYSYMHKGLGYGASVYNGGLRLGFICLLKEFSKNYPSHAMIVSPHNKNVGYIRSLATNNSIRDCHNGNGPLVVLISELKAKIDDLWAKLGLV